jgi:tagatose-1,6-bisphosphate aldolase
MEPENTKKLEQFKRNNFEMITPLEVDQREYLRDIFASLMTQAELIEKQINAIKLKCNRILDSLRDGHN